MNEYEEKNLVADLATPVFVGARDRSYWILFYRLMANLPE